ncbi:MAG: bifunctional oligoribonuclease/PAP phosphatase NrnA [Candidatus Omnitrophica bacterium]|nr:bifunctional oligoribonuclease/PAP phosphatase NrnA [Candidatus Omnitrophota bacterium]
MSWEKVKSLIKSKNDFVITTHLNPDPDALCSELALHTGLKKLGKKVQIINDEPLPDRFSFLPSANKIKGFQPYMKLADRVLIVLDCGELNRIGKVEQLVTDDAMIINIDHHVTNDDFGSVNVVDHLASSTAQMIYEMHQVLKVSLTRDSALCLYTGIMADTGSFVYDNTTAQTHAIVAHLMGFDFSAYDVYRQLYEQVPLEDLKSLNKIVSRFDALYDDKVIVVDLKKRIFKKFSENFDLRDKIFKTLRTIRGSEIYVIFSEEKRNKTQVNFRSSGKVDVASLARCYGGGGHKKASGCTLDQDFKTTKAIVLKQVQKLVSEL